MPLRALAVAAAVVAIACNSKPESIEPTPGPEKAEAPSPEAAGAETADEAAEPSAVAAQAAEPEAPETATVGEPAPAFTLTDQAGESHSLADHRGEIVVLEWTNPQCPYVQRHYQAETMKGLVSRFADDDVAWMAIDSSHFVEPEDSASWHEAQGLDYPILQDPDGAVGRAYGARTTPHMFVIDREGVLRYSGAIDDDVHGRKDEPTNHVGQAVEALLAGEAPPRAQTEPYGCSVKYQS